MSLQSFVLSNPVISSSAIGALGNLGGGILNAFMQKKINKENIAFQREINDTNYQRQLDMWNMTNEYNSPAAQMNRYIAAGLNPNLIYGQSNTAQMASVGNSVAQQKVAPNFDFLGHFMNQIVDAFQKEQDFKYRKEEVSQQEIQTFIMENTKDAQVELSNNQAKYLSKQLTIIGYQIEDREIDKAIKTAQKTINDVGAQSAVQNFEYDKQFYDMGLPPDLEPHFAVLFSMLGSLVHAVTGKVLNFKELSSMLGQEVSNALGSQFK